jgi:hypothetical protein
VSVAARLDGAFCLASALCRAAGYDIFCHGLIRPHLTKREPNADVVTTASGAIVRAYQAEDESCVVSMWLKSYAHSREVQETGLQSASVDGHPDEIRFWKIHQPIVMGLLAESTILVACDPERATYEPGKPAVIWAWACVSGDTIHWVAVKRNAVKADLGPDLVRDLLGDRLEREQRTTFEMTDMSRMRLIPKGWKRDRGWLSALRSLSTRMLDRDRLFAAVGGHVLDMRRQEWRQSSERAA